MARNLDFLLSMVRSSPLLRAIPDVRKHALRETLRLATSEEDVTEILLANLTGSPYIPDDLKTNLATLILEKQWAELGSALRCEPGSVVEDGSEFDEFRAMVISIFSRSRRLEALDYTRRHRLGSAMHQARSRDELIAIAMGALENAQTLDGAGRERVANDILDGRFDRLLLPDRFDCDERPRRQGAAPPADGSAEVPVGMPVVEEPEECPVCLGTSLVERQLPCGHTFCDACITQWAGSFAPSPTFACPLCRAETPLAAIAARPRVAAPGGGFHDMMAALPSESARLRADP